MESKTLIAAGFRHVAEEWDRLARGEPGNDAQAANRAGRLIVAAFHRGLLPDLPGLEAVIREAENPPWSAEFDQAHGSPRMTNVFTELCGGHMVLCQRQPDGQLKPATLSSGGILPSLAPEVLPGEIVADPESPRRVCQRKAWICRWLAEQVEREGGPWSRPDSPKCWAKIFGVDRRTLLRREAVGKLRIKKDSRRRWRIHVDDLLESEE